MSQKVVIDTNVLVSALLSRQGNPAQIIDLILDRRLVFIYCTNIIVEYEKVLFRKKFNFNNELVRILINTLQYSGFNLEPRPSNIPFSDETDRIFYDTAANSKAVLITGNIKHFPKQNFVMTPTEFIRNYL